MFRSIIAVSFAVLTVSLGFGSVRAEAKLEEEKSIWVRRFEQDAKWRREGLALIPYRSNYLMPVTYNTSPHPTSRNRARYEEAKFQFSIKVLLVDNLFYGDTHLYFGYTQLSLWQVYDRSRSSPFRESLYEPELILTQDHLFRIGNVMLRQSEIALSHQSNGRSEPDSRGWDRLYARFLFDHDGLAFTLRPWVRMPTKKTRDDNKDIERYMGYGEVDVAYYFKNHILSVMVRNNLRPNDNKGAVEVNYSFPLTRILTGLVQYFNGYGETLIDYNRPVNRFSVGIALSNW